MISLFKKHICDHEWFDLGISTQLDRYCIIPDFITVGRVYCPKCDTRKTLYRDEYELVLKEQKIKNEYKNRSNKSEEG